MARRRAGSKKWTSSTSPTSAGAAIASCHGPLTLPTSRRHKYVREEGQLFACGALATQLDHSHETGAFIAYKCRACNLRGRRRYRIGWRGARR